MKKAQLVQQSDMAEIQAKEKSMQAEFELKERLSDAQMAHEMQIEQLRYQMKMMELSQSQSVSLESIKAALATDTMKLTTQKQLSFASMQHDTDKQTNGHHHEIAKGVSTPLTEPVGKAAPGHSYEQ